jgi:hypothetical protein
MQMKKTMMALMIAAVTAGTAFAEQGDDGGQRRKGKSWGDDPGGKQAWGQRDERGGDEERPGGPMMDPAQMEQMRADHKVIRELGQSARAETDEDKKAEIVSQLRVKLGEVADRMQANQEKRLAQAEERLTGLKARIDEEKTNRDSRIEEQIQRILSGERPQRPERFNKFPNAKGGMPGHEPACGGMPPPPAEDMPDDMPPPPAE